MAAQQAGTDDDGDDEELDEIPNARLPKEATITVAQSEEIPVAPSGPAAGGPVRTEEERQHRREYFREVRGTKMDSPSTARRTSSKSSLRTTRAIEAI